MTWSASKQGNAERSETLPGPTPVPTHTPGGDECIDADCGTSGYVVSARRYSAAILGVFADKRQHGSL